MISCSFLYLAMRSFKIPMKISFLFLLRTEHWGWLVWQRWTSPEPLSQRNRRLSSVSYPVRELHVYERFMYNHDPSELLPNCILDDKFVAFLNKDFVEKRSPSKLKKKILLTVRSMMWYERFKVLFKIGRKIPIPFYGRRVCFKLYLLLLKSWTPTCYWWI